MNPRRTVRQIADLTEDQLKKFSTQRLLSIHRKLVARMGYLNYRIDLSRCFSADEVQAAANELRVLMPFRGALHRVMATREHIERKPR